MPQARNANLTDGRWRVHLDGFPDVTTDELTLDDIEQVEKVCGIPWSLINPLASAKEAKGMLALLLMRAGKPEDEALRAAGKTPLRQLAAAFSYELPDRTQPATSGPADGAGADPPS
jgi:hypothetical protein